jgi:hypothetical protein
LAEEPFADVPDRPFADAPFADGFDIDGFDIDGFDIDTGPPPEGRDTGFSGSSAVSAESSP